VDDGFILTIHDRLLKRVPRRKPPAPMPVSALKEDHLQDVGTVVNSPNLVLKDIKINDKTKQSTLVISDDWELNEHKPVWALLALGQVPCSPRRDLAAAVVRRV